MALLNFTAQQPVFTKRELLLHGNIPKPLHQLAPRTIYGQEWWDMERRQAYEINNYCCWACGIHKSQALYHQWLEGHEIYKFDWKVGSAEYLGTCALCHGCHNYIHRGRLRMLYDDKEITRAKYYTIIKHGESLVGRADLPVPDEIQQDWTKWHLLLHGAKHYSRFENLEHWRKHFAR